MYQPILASSTTKLFLTGGLVTALAVAACQRGDAARPASTTTTSAGIPAPQATGTTSRTIDNAGFVDNGGRTSDMLTRTEASGMRATEAGSERPTGTPGSGAPIPIGPTPPPNIGEGAGAASSVRGTSGPHPSGGPPVEALARFARARCDRETVCNRVGPGASFSTQEACLSEQRERIRSDVDALACPRGIDILQLGTCLTAIRLQSCDDRRVDVEALPDCAASALCAPAR
ncbi:MAG: hypothetical protein JWP87_975 [Labilithrix sp.]|nr:hypothetical protein [Labilithrix sp.]